MADPGRRLSEELQSEARWWLSQTWGDQGLRLHAERTAALLERAAKLAALVEDWQVAARACMVPTGVAVMGPEAQRNAEAIRALLAFDSGPEDGR
jgi:hypothetical protein